MKFSLFYYPFMLIILFLFFICPLSADDKGEWGVAPVAAPYYTPDTKWGLGAYVVPYYNPPENSPFTRPDEYTFYAAYTQMKQVTFGFLPEIYLSAGNFKISCIAEYNNYPSSFWGKGPDTDEEAEEAYTPVEYWGDLAFLIRINNSFYAGPMIHLRKCSVVDTEYGGMIGSGAVPGSEDSFESGTGFAFQFDTRDSIFYPRRGFFIKEKSSFQYRAAGSDYCFGRHEFDARFFKGLHGDHVIAFQFKAKVSHGEVPLRSLCGIGGNEIMRGYRENRYMDKTSLAGQAEYRFPLVWRLAGVVNASAGEVQGELKRYNTGDIHYAAGAGLRLIIDREEHIAGRIDLGMDENGTVSVYVLAKEAF